MRRWTSQLSTDLLRERGCKRSLTATRARPTWLHAASGGGVEPRRPGSAPSGMGTHHVRAGEVGGSPPASRRVLRVLIYLIAGLALLAVLALWSVQVLGEDSFPGQKTFQKQFLLDNENNIPTWFSSALLLGAAALSSVLGLELDGGRGRGWMGLAVIFVLMSIDETASIHETVNSTLREGLDLQGALRFGWVIPAAVFLVVFAVVYWRFVWGLPSGTRTRISLAGIVYVSGAFGMEMVGGWYWDAYGGGDTFGYGAITTAEELLELIGLALLIYALLFHAERFRPRLVSDSSDPD
jgi:hypothetical protein